MAQRDMRVAGPNDRNAMASGYRVTWIGMGINLVLVAAKLWTGTVAKSHALIADGIHSASDLVTDIAVLLGLRWGRKEADRDHPWGHGRIETIASMIVGLFLLLAAVSIGYDALRAIYEHGTPVPGRLALYVAGASVIVKEVLFWMTLLVGRRLDSPALIGNAWHHRSDALSSVAVFFGIGASLINPEWVLADAFAALLVTLLVARVGFGLIWDALKELSDIAPDEGWQRKVHDIAYSVEGVRQVHDIKARYSGSEIFAELDVVVDPDLTVREGHEIAVAVKQRLQARLPRITHLKIHIDPELKPEE